MRLLLLTCLLAALSGCATVEDIRSLKIIIADLQSGSITRTEFNTRVDAVADEAEERADNLAKGALTLTEAASGAGGITGLGMLALGLYRNHTRRKLGAPVTTQPPTA